MRFIINLYTGTKIHLLEGATPDLFPFSVMCSSALHTLRYFNGISLCEFNGVGERVSLISSVVDNIFLSLIPRGFFIADRSKKSQTIR